MQRVTLSEMDVLGASLEGKRPEELKVPQLKQWLLCRGALTKGKKADLVEQYAILFTCKYSR